MWISDDQGEKSTFRTLAFVVLSFPYWTKPTFSSWPPLMLHDDDDDRLARRRTSRRIQCRANIALHSLKRIHRIIHERP